MVFVCTRYAFVSTRYCIYNTSCSMNTTVTKCVSSFLFFFFGLMQETPNRPAYILHVQQKRIMTPNSAKLVIRHL